MSLNPRKLVLLSLGTAVLAMPAGAQARHAHKTKSAAKREQPKVEPLPDVRMLPVDTVGGDSIRTIVQRDLQYGDRLLMSDSATIEVKIVRSDARLNVSLMDIVTGESKRSGSFPLPVVPEDRSQAIRDSAARELDIRAQLAVTTLARDSIVRDSLLRAAAAPAPKKKTNTKERAAARLIAAQRDSAVKNIEARRLNIFAQVRRDTLLRDSVLPVLLSADSLERDRATRKLRLALHTMSDEIEFWLTGTRGIASTRVAYTRDTHLHIVDSDGAFDDVISTPHAALSPSWHPLAKAIVYSDFDNSGTQIGEVDLTTNDVRLISATKRGLNITPIFTPDGAHIVYASGGDMPADLVVTGANDSTPARPLGIGGYENTSPTFSPDGNRIAFMSPRPELTPQIYTMNADGTSVKLLTPFAKGKRSYRTGPDWSPTGDAVAFEQQDGDFQVWMISLKSGKMTKLTTFAENEDPSWAPDGRHMAITSTRGGTREIWVLDTKTGHFRQLTHSPAGGARLAAWSPPLHPMFSAGALAASVDGKIP